MIRLSKFRRIALPLGILLGGILLAVLFVLTADEPEALQPGARAPVVSVSRVSIASVSPALRVFGEVESPNMSMLTAVVEADIIKVSALEGEFVARGQEIIVMDDVDAELSARERAAELAEVEAMIESDQVQLEADRAALKAEQSLLQLARAAVQRAAKLAKSQLGSEAAFDAAKQEEQRQLLAVTQRRQAIDGADARRAQLTARRDKAAAALQRAERERNRARVTAPFDGRVTAIMVAPGDRAARGAELAQLYAETELEVRAQIPDAHVPALRAAVDAGREVRAQIFADARGIALRLHRLSASVAAGQGGIDAFFRAYGDAQLPVPGETVEVQLELPPVANAVTLPADSLYGSGRVYVVRDGILHAQSVRRLGQLERGGRQMLVVESAGFRDGDEILSSRLPQAVDGLQVRVVR